MLRWLEQRWYTPEPSPVLLRPLAAIYGSIATARRRRLTGKAPALACPVIVVGNISLGGTGKTPFVIWLVERLRAWGHRPGVISRGYGGHASGYPLRVRHDSDPAQAGDEPVLIAWRTGVPVMVDPDRVRAACALIETGEVNVLVADDGLQHYRLQRGLEICVVDGRRGLGNGDLLPAGPLREAATRLDEVNLVVANGGGFRAPRTPTLDMRLVTDSVVALRGGGVISVGRFVGRRVHAVAGIGHPPRFFDMLAARGIEVIPHPFPDHHAYTAGDITFGDALPVLMTEKDAVKCRVFSGSRHHAVPVSASIDAADENLVQQSITSLKF
ncbi:MAG: tetraacyldisaccharide 4'-kinase [Panacagrimonas sp.]